jgi:hypothetical protein
MQATYPASDFSPVVVSSTRENRGRPVARRGYAERAQQCCVDCRVACQAQRLVRSAGLIQLVRIIFLQELMEEGRAFVADLDDLCADAGLTDVFDFYLTLQGLSGIQLAPQLEQLADRKRPVADNEEAFRGEVLKQAGDARTTIDERRAAADFNAALPPSFSPH